MAKDKNLVKGLIGLAVAAPIAGASIGIIGSSGIPVPLARGTSALIGVGLLKGAAEIVELGQKEKEIFGL